MSKKDKLAASGSVPSPENDWESEQHANDLMRAGEVLSDPTKMKKAMKHIKKKKRAMKSIADLKQFHNDKYGAKQKSDLTVDNDTDTDDMGI